MLLAIGCWAGAVLVIVAALEHGYALGRKHGYAVGREHGYTQGCLDEVRAMQKKLEEIREPEPSPGSAERSH